MSIHAEKVWTLTDDGQEVLLPVSSVKAGDLIRVHMGNVIPFDGDVQVGEAMVNQTSLTGESHACAQGRGQLCLCGNCSGRG